MEKKQLLLGGKILSYYESRSGKTDNILVFLHGWKQNGKSFEAIFKILEEKDIAYISLDLPGFGQSALRHNNMKIEEYGEVVKEAIEKLGLSKPILVGHSFWGRISIYLGSYYENISKIILIGSAGIAYTPSILRKIVTTSGKVILSFPGLSKIKNKVKNSVSSSDYQNAGKLEKIFRNTISNDLRKYMTDISLPTLMIWGKDDDQTPVSEAEIIHEHIQNSELHILDGWHFVHQEQSQKITDMILDFIKK